MKQNMLSSGLNMRWESSRMMFGKLCGPIKIEQMKIEKPALDEQQTEDIELPILPT
ncbi:hypothetical protein ABES80_15620 [Bacillus gobiensis]|uniref:hypothetical protein n=1 Tax=Bacillus gobiensis TaxID=1441095 RepID=UPI003D1E2C8C